MHPLTFMTSLDSSCLHPLSVRIITLLTIPGLPHNHCCYLGNQPTNASYQTLPQINLPTWPQSINLPNAPYQALPWIIVTWPPNHQTPHQCWFQTLRKVCVKQLPMTLHLTSLICALCQPTQEISQPLALPTTPLQIIAFFTNAN